MHQNASKNGTIETPANLKWKGQLNLINKLKQKIKNNIFLTNDANCAAVGEMMYGNARSLNDFIVITLGTGLGSGIVSNGLLVEGKDGFAAELGHFSINKMGRYTGLGTKGTGSLCLQQELKEQLCTCYQNIRKIVFLKYFI